MDPDAILQAYVGRTQNRIVIIVFVFHNHSLHACSCINFRTVDSGNLYWMVRGEEIAHFHTFYARCYLTHFA